jgi:hypothetical protein
MDRKNFIIALLIWFIGLPISIALSFTLRYFGDYNSLGMPEFLWFFIHLCIFVFSTLKVYISFSKMDFIKKIMAMVFVTFTYGLYYIALTWLYVIESGIDSV